MATEFFEATRFSPDSIAIIRLAQQICTNYAGQGYDLSLRQLYYQFISRDYFPNTEQSYKRLGSIIADARLAGLIDWDVIQDRGRNTVGNNHWDSPADILDACARQFMFDTWDNQPNHVEVMVEKQALEGVLEPVCSALDIRFSANKGYSSASHLYETGKRLQEKFVGTGDYLDYDHRSAFEDDFDTRFFQEGAWVSYHDQDKVVALDDRGKSKQADALVESLTREYMLPHPQGGKKVHIIYLGDHDPSGIDMTRDVKDRLELFSRCPVEVHRVALNMDQVRQYNPPPNPAKLTDSRADAYIAKYGSQSWELDALNPETLASTVTGIVENLRDGALWNQALLRRETARQALTAMAERYREA